jgi:hypothetical protein
MSKHYANANWEGNLTKGKGKYTIKTTGAQGNLKSIIAFNTINLKLQSCISSFNIYVLRLIYLELRGKL